MSRENRADKDAEIERLKEAYANTAEIVEKSFERCLAGKDAEIARLKAENEKLQKLLVHWNIKDDVALITELCDALEWWEKQGDYRPAFSSKLIQRGREAVK